MSPSAGTGGEAPLLVPPAGGKGWQWRPPAPWQGRVDDPDDPAARRWHQAVRLWPGGALPPAGSARRVWLIGAASDIGVERNLGRRGAAAAPGQIRRAMANLPSLFEPRVELWDGGDIVPLDDDLEGFSTGLAAFTAAVVAGGGFPIVLGGGHEVALGHYEGLRSGLRARGGGAPLRIVNFDAHFDLRPVEPAVGLHSGNMFRRIAELCRGRGEPFLYHVIGIQQSANTRSLFHLAEELGVDVHLARDLGEQRLGAMLTRMASWLRDDIPLHVTLCCDVFAAAHAPGVSAPQPFGLNPEIVLELLRFLGHSDRVVGLDVAEAAPRFDHDNRTAHLAAVLLFAWINAMAGVAFPDP